MMRAWSWRGELNLLIDYGELATPDEVAQKWMDDWMSQLRLFIS